MKALKSTGIMVVAVVAAVMLCGRVYGTESDALKALVKDEMRICKDIPVERNIDAVTAYRMSIAQKAPIVDVRTVQEYQFVGHVQNAYHIPAFVWGKWDEQKKTFGTEPNPDFVKQFTSVFPDKKAAIIVMCRSGHRSGKAIKLLLQAGYTNLYQMWEGFEGIAITDKELPSYGKKIVDGWKNRGLPYTWDMDPQYIVMK
ncbi:MAG TPA: rhodanese-like domain-containing protein [Nitrospirota bacterium]